MRVCPNLIVQCIEKNTRSVERMEMPVGESICRICLRRMQDTKCLFSEDDESKLILKKIHICFQIIVNFETDLPSSICSKCIEELNMAYNFRLNCVSFEERFASLCQPLSDAIQPPGIEVTKDVSRDYNHFLLPGVSHDEYDDNRPEYQKCIENQLTDTECYKIEKKFRCTICSKTLKTEASLQKHNISMHVKRKHIGKVTGSGVNRRYHCTKCLYSTPHSQTLVNHMRRHDGQRPYHCYCGKSFTQSASLTAHQKTHTEDAYFVCATCGKQFKHTFTLRKHLHVHEAGSFTCNICQKTLKSQQSLKDHMHRHYNIRNFNCEDCGATFVASSELLNHRKRHDTRKTAECHLCGYKTHSKKNLILHLKRHAGEKAYRCEDCGVKVYTSSDLRRHRRVHSRAKPFPCPACPQRFSHSPSLNKHVRNVHGLQYRWGDTVNTSKPIKDEKV